VTRSCQWMGRTWGTSPRSTPPQSSRWGPCVTGHDTQELWLCC